MKRIIALILAAIVTTFTFAVHASAVIA